MLVTLQPGWPPTGVSTSTAESVDSQSSGGSLQTNWLLMGIIVIGVIVTVFYRYRKSVKRQPNDKMQNEPEE